DGHGDVSSSTLTITVNIDPETVTASPDSRSVSDDANRKSKPPNSSHTYNTADAVGVLHVTTTGNLTGSLGGTMVMAADGSYSYAPLSFPNVATMAISALSLHVALPISDGHGDVSSSTLTITVNIDPETVTASPDSRSVSDD